MQKKYAKPKEVNRIDGITEYRQTDGDADGDNIVGMG